MSDPTISECGHRLARLEERVAANKDLFERALDAHCTQDIIRHEAAEKAQLLFSNTLESWKIHSNEWRDAMNDREREFLPRTMGIVIGIISVISMLLVIFDRLK